MAPQQTLDVDALSAYGGEPGVHRVLARLLPPGRAAGQARRLLREVLTAAGVTGEALSDAELVVSELAANAELHAREPYELRVLITEAHPVWCEIADGGPGLGEVAAVLAGLRTANAPVPGLPWAGGVTEEPDPTTGTGSDPAAGTEPDLVLWEENGRGLLLAHRLTGGHCCVYPTRLLATGERGKAVAFPLPVALSS